VTLSDPKCHFSYGSLLQGQHREKYNIDYETKYNDHLSSAAAAFEWNYFSRTDFNAQTNDNIWETVMIEHSYNGRLLGKCRLSDRSTNPNDPQ